MFKTHIFDATPRHREVYSLYEKVYTAIDLVAASAFVIGSILFFDEDLATTATWFFLIGSLCFAAKPISRFAREYHLANLPLPGDDTADGDSGA